MRIVSGVLAIALAAATPAAAAETIEIQEWKAPFEGVRPRSASPLDAHSVWFASQGGGFLARFNARTGEFQRVNLKDGSAPADLTVGPDGAVWFADPNLGRIGRYDPAKKEFRSFALGGDDAVEPRSIVVDPAGDVVWFATRKEAAIGRLTVESGDITLVPLTAKGARPYALALGPDGAVWAALFGASRIARVAADDLTLTEIDLPRAAARPRQIAAAADGRVWYADYEGGHIGVYDPRRNAFAEWPMPQGAASHPFGMTTDASGRVWVAATGVQPNIIVGFDPRREEFFSETRIPSGGGAVRAMRYHQGSGAIWFATDTNYIGRAVVEPYLGH